ncbi:MAG: TRAM domain-containing protein [bacterium]
MLEPGAVLPVSVERFAALGRGVARVDGQALLVRRGVAGEAVRVRVERVYAKYALARVVSVEQAAADRVEPPCPHFDACGGCDWQHLSLPAQAGLKRTVLGEQLARIGGLQPPEDWRLESAPPEDSLAYRDKLEFVPVSDGAAWRPGLHGEDGLALPIGECLLAPPYFSTLAMAVLESLTGAGVLPPPPSAGSAPPNLIRLTVQGTEKTDGSPGLSLLLHLKAGPGEKPAPLLRRYAEAVSDTWSALQVRVPQAEGVALLMGGGENRGGGKTRGGKTRGGRRKPRLEVVRGENLLRKRVAGRLYLAPLNGFFQVNLAMASRMTAHLIEVLEPRLLPPETERPGPEALPLLFDLYGGAGLFALPLAASGFRVLCVDSDKWALRAGEDTARAAAVEHCRFHRRNLENPGALGALIGREGAPAAMIVNPPRRGLAPSLLADMLKASPPLLVYVSCDGGTFARDAARLSESYRMTSLRGFDLFPHTHHLEIAAAFERREA